MQPPSLYAFAGSLTPLHRRQLVRPVVAAAKDLACTLLLCAGVAGLAFGPTFTDERRVISQSQCSHCVAAGALHSIRFCSS
ncbi:hypothetical protein [Janthinobacterium tructae]